MRIRKRFPSALSSNPPPDLQLIGSPAVQRQTEANPDENLCVEVGNTASQPSDPPNQPVLRRPASYQGFHPETGNNRWVFSGTGDDETKLKLKKRDGEEEDKEGRWREKERGTNDTSKITILGTEIMVTGALQSPLYSPHNQGERVVPLKKRILSMERGAAMEEEDDEKKIKTKMKSKMNMKCRQHQEEEEENDDEEEKYPKKKKRRGRSVMEGGSRCSRVNGRGWRCSQKTLVGYSLCEHHSGKSATGRLRINGAAAMAGSNNNMEKDENEERMIEIGMVKARSINSLLSQTNSMTHES